MFLTILAGLFFIGAFVSFAVAIINRRDPDYFFGWLAAAVVVFVLGVLSFGLGSYNKVGEGQVGIPVTFGRAGDPVGPGAHWLAPWTDVVIMDTRDKEVTFENAADREEDFRALSAQAQGGGNLTVEMTVQFNLLRESAADVYRSVGTDYVEVYVLPISRSCIRDVTPLYTPEEAFTSARRAIAEETLECMIADLEPRGITVDNVLIRDIDPGEAVRTAINEKVAAEQDVQRAEVRRDEATINAEIEAIEALATKNAEQIIACGGSEQPNPRAGEPGQPDILVVPDEECGEQFSANYLQWLYIQTLPNIDNLTLIAPSIDGEILLPIQ